MIAPTYEHVKRLRAIFCEQLPLATLPPPTHLLVLGPSGTGKTHLIRLLFEEILGLPVVVADATRFTEAGYAGDDLPTLLTRLYQAAGRDLPWASCGVVCIDELDKLASRPGTQGRDPSGEGVQAGLLAMMSAPSTEFPAELGIEASRREKLVMPLHSLTFVGAGAFTRLQQERTLQPKEVGFGRAPANVRACALPQDHAALSEAVIGGGLMAELAGRFQRMVALEKLSHTELKLILTDNLLPKHYDNFAREGVKLEIADEALDQVVAQALKTSTGARALNSVLGEVLQEAEYQCFGEGGRYPKARITFSGTELKAEVAGCDAMVVHKA